MENYKKYENFTKKIFEKLNANFIENNLYSEFDYMIELNRQKYAVEVKSKMANHFMVNGIFRIRERRQKLGNDWKVILIFFDKVDKGTKNAIQKGGNTIVLDISNILYIINNDEEVYNELMDILDFSIKDIEQLVPKISIKLPNNIREEDFVDVYIRRLETLNSGKELCKDYEELMVEILKFLFKDEMLKWNEQNKTEEGLSIFDLICKIKKENSSDFWDMIQKYYNSKYVIWEFKNYSDPITQEQVCTTEKYLYATALRRVAIIVTRKGIDKNGRKVVKGILRESGKLILVLDDEDIKNMLEAKKNYEDPSETLSEKLDEILMQLDK